MTEQEKQEGLTDEQLKALPDWARPVVEVKEYFPETDVPKHTVTTVAPPLRLIAALADALIDNRALCGQPLTGRTTCTIDMRDSCALYHDALADRDAARKDNAALRAEVAHLQNELAEESSAAGMSLTQEQDNYREVADLLVKSRAEVAKLKGLLRWAYDRVPDKEIVPLISNQIQKALREGEAVA